jgi:hypothetical protein
LRSETITVGTEIVDVINDPIYEFKSSAIVTGEKFGLLGQLSDAKKKRLEENVCFGIKELVQMCLEDDDIMTYVYNSPAPSAQHARYQDWFFEYARDIIAAIDRLPATAYINKNK